MLRTSCRACHSRSGLHEVLDLGWIPLANNLLLVRDASVARYPLQLIWCETCGNLQLSEVMPPEWMFSHYPYLSSTTKTLRAYTEEVAVSYIKKFNLTERSYVLDIGSNDGLWLEPYQTRGIKVLGVEPSNNVSKIANGRGIKTIHGFFGDDVVNEIRKSTPALDLVLASNVLAHTDDAEGMLKRAFELLKPDGTMVVEFQHALSMLEDLTFDNIYHEHVNYWSLMSLARLCASINLVVVSAERVDINGGSLRCFIKRKGEGERDDSVRGLWMQEFERGMLDQGVWRGFGAMIREARSVFRINFMDFKIKHGPIAGYGAPAKATTLLNYFGMIPGDLMYTLEDNDLKHGKFIPGLGTEILGLEALQKDRPGGVLVLAWNYLEEIKFRLKCEGFEGPVYSTKEFYTRTETPPL
jgi:SAM-dependent methyltransferase